MRSKTSLLGGIAAAVLAAALIWYFFLFNSATERYITTERQVRIGETSIAVGIADTAQEREQGLSGTTALAEREGLLFVFERNDQHSFWMKDMQYAIDIIWISADKRVVYIAKDVSPDTFPHSFTPPTPARYVLQVPAGFSSGHDIMVGDMLEVSLQ
jgi:hypothetical protein